MGLPAETSKWGCHYKSTCETAGDFGNDTVTANTILYVKWTAGGAGTGGSGNTPNSGDSKTAWPYAAMGILAAAAIAGICLKKCKAE